MPQRIRCRFEIFSSEVAGLPADVEAVKLVVDHQKVSKRYAASDSIAASGGITSQPEDTAEARSLLNFTCHVYPTKAVNLRLMGSSSRERPSLLSPRSNWTQLATATLPLDQLAQQLLLPGVAPAPATPRTSTELNGSRQQATAPPQIIIPEQGPGAEQVVSPTLTASPPTSPFAVGSMGFGQLPPVASLLDTGDDIDDADSELFTTDSVAAAVTARRSAAGGSAAGKKLPGSSNQQFGSLGDLRDFENDVNNEDVQKAAQDTADVPPAAVWGMGSAGGYGVELQSSRLAVNWVPTQEGLMLQQQLVVHAHLLQARASGWAGGLFSPTKGGSVISSSRRTSTSATTASGSQLTRKKWTDKLYRGPKRDTGSPVAGPAVPRSVTSPALRDDGQAPPVKSIQSAPVSPAVPLGVNVAGRLPSFEPWVDSTEPTPTGDTSHLPAGHPLNFFGTRGPASPRDTSAPLPPASGAAGHPSAAVPSGANSGQQQAAEAADAAADQAAKHEFLQLILATLGGAQSLESESALPPPSAAQLAAAASLPRAPSAADLEAFAAAAGLPIDKVAEAAAAKLGTGSSPTSVTPSGNSSARASPRRNKEQQMQQEQSAGSVGADVLAPELPAAPAPTPALGTTSAGARPAPVTDATEHLLNASGAESGDVVPDSGSAEALGPELPPAPASTPWPAATSEPPSTGAAASRDTAEPLSPRSVGAGPAELAVLAEAAQAVTDAAQARKGTVANTAIDLAPAPVGGNSVGSDDLAAPESSANVSSIAAALAAAVANSDAVDTADAVGAESTDVGSAATAVPDSSAAGSGVAAAVAAAVQEAAAAAAEGEVVTVVVESVETAPVGPGGEEVAVPVVTIAEATLVPSSAGAVEAQADLTTALSDELDTAVPGPADVAPAGTEHAAASAEPTAVVTATAIAVIDDNSSGAAAGPEGWQPQQLAVATTTITATPVPAGDTAAGIAAAGATEEGTTDVVVTCTTDVAITHISDADLAGEFPAVLPMELTAPAGAASAEAAAPSALSYFDTEGPGGLPGAAEAAPIQPVYRGESLGLGAVGEGTATQLHPLGGRSASAVVDEFSKAAAAADASAAAAAAFAAQYGAADLGSAVPGAARSGNLSEQFSPAGPAADTHTIEETVVVVESVQTELLQNEQDINPALLPSDETLELQAVFAAPEERGAAEAAPVEVTYTEVTTVSVQPVSETQPFAAATELAVPQAPAAVQEFIESYPATSAGLLSESAPEETPAPLATSELTPQGMLVISVPQRKLQQHQGAQPLQPSASGTSRLAEVLERINSQPITPAAATTAATAETWPMVSGRFSSQELGTESSTPAGVSPSSAIWRAAGTVAAAVPEILMSASLAMVRLIAAAAFSRTRAKPTERASTSSASTTNSTAGRARSLVTTAAQHQLLSTVAGAAYRSTRRLTTIAFEATVFSIRSMALGLFSFWMLLMTALFVRPWLAVLRRVVPVMRALPGALLGAAAAAARNRSSVSRQLPGAATVVAAVIPAAETAATEETSSISSSMEEQEATSAATRLLSGGGVAPAGGSWLWRGVRAGVSRSGSNSSSTSASWLVPPTPAPSLEAGVSSASLLERSWSNMLSLISPALSRSPSVSSSPSTPPPTPQLTANTATAAVAAGMQPLDLAPGSSAAAVGSGVSGGKLARKSRLGQATPGGLATIASATNLAAAADAAEATAGTLDTVEVTTTLTETTVVTDVADTTAVVYPASSYSSWWWGAAPAADTTGHSSSSWWPTWGAAVGRSAAVDSSVLAGAEQDVLATAAAPATATSWLPDWLLMRTSVTTTTTTATVPDLSASSLAAAADLTAPADVPADVAGTTPVTLVPDRVENAAMQSTGGWESAVDIAPRNRGWFACMTYQVMHLAMIFEQLVQMVVLTPVMWYVDAVGSVLRSGVNTATGLVELAVWWALLPWRLAWWGITLPYKATSAVLSFAMHSSRRMTSQQRAGTGVAVEL